MTALLSIDRVKERLIADGIAEVTECYPEGSPQRLGAIDGFELAARLETREQFEKVLAARHRREGKHIGEVDTAALDAYWRHRYGTLQVEWVLKCLIVAGWNRPGDLISGLAFRKIAEIIETEDAHAS